MLSALFFYLFADPVRGRGLHGHRGEEPRACGAVSHPRLLQCRRPVRAARRRVPGDDPGRGLCRRRHGAVPVRGDDARCRFRRAPRGLHQISADRRHHRSPAPRRADPDPGRLGHGARNRRAGADAARRRYQQHRGARAHSLYALRLSVRGGGSHPAGRHDRRHRAYPASQARREAPDQLPPRCGAPARNRRTRRGRDRGGACR